MEGTKKMTLYKTAQVALTGEYVSLIAYSESRDAYKIGKIDNYICKIPLWLPARALTSFVL